MLRKPALAFVAVVAAGAIGVFTAGGRPPADNDRPADRAAIMKSVQDFQQAFDKKDAKGIAAQWTDNGEMEEESGQLVRGRAAPDGSAVGCVRFSGRGGAARAPHV